MGKKKDRDKKQEERDAAEMAGINAIRDGQTGVVAMDAAPLMFELVTDRCDDHISLAILETAINVLGAMVHGLAVYASAAAVNARKERGAPAVTQRDAEHVASMLRPLMADLTLARLQAIEDAVNTGKADLDVLRQIAELYIGPPIHDAVDKNAPHVKRVRVRAEHILDQIKAKA